MSASDPAMTPREPSGCCSPSQPGRERGRVAVPGHGSGEPGATDEMVTLRGGVFLMGSEDAEAYPDDGEGPVRSARVDPFRIARHAVTNAGFGAFVTATGYVTDAEDAGYSFVFAGLLSTNHPPTRAVQAAPWWRQAEGACWQRPEGPHSDLDGREDHPVVHVTWHDAQAYCAWSGTRLPSEPEWEYAARGGLVQMPFPWGSALEPGGRHRMNVWQGEFPQHNSAADGFVATCPVDTYRPNRFGLYNMTGNVWEWTGGDALASQDRVTRGGSYLCHASYCRRYRVSARSSLTADSFAGNVGFRCAMDLPEQGGSLGEAVD